MLRKLPRRAYFAWLGLLALSIQVFIPALVAVEIGRALAEGDQLAFAPCIFGQQLGDQGNAGKNPHPGQAGIGGCPICVAMQANPAFTTPSTTPLPPPPALAISTVAIATESAPSLLAPASY